MEWIRWLSGRHGEQHGSQTTVANSGAKGIPAVADVVVIGGGIVGCTAALCIARNQVQQGHQPNVVLIEQQSIGAGASGLSAGTLWSGGWGQLKKRAPTSTDVTPMLCAGTMDLLNDLQRSGHDCSLRQNGALSIACSMKQVFHLAKTYLYLKYRGFDCEAIIGSKRLAEVEPGLRSGSVLAAIRTPLSGHVDPLATTIALGEAASKAGATIVEGVSVKKISVSPGDGAGSAHPTSKRYSIITKCGQTLQTNSIVLASGAWFDYLKGDDSGDRSMVQFDIPVKPVKGQMWITDTLPFSSLRHVIYITESHTQWAAAEGSSLDVNAGIPEYCTHDSFGNKVVRHAYGRQLVDGRIAFGGDRQRCTANDYSIDDNSIMQHRAHCSEFLDASIMEGPLQGSWAGIMPFSMDGQPLVGELSDIGYPGLWLAAGFGPHGIMEGPYAAKLIADAVTNHAKLPKVVAQKFDPCRSTGIRNKA